jgi:asparagine synthase (glutamine-hydrolysing)
MRVTAGGCGIAPYYWTEPHVIDDGVARTTSRSLVLEAVRRQLVADVPVGSLLSGGIDSSVITIAMKLAGADVETFSIGFGDPRYDEREHAEAVARHVGARHHQFEVRPDAATDLPRLAQVFGEPFGDSSALPVHYLARETRRHVKVAISGDGGDELFGGYDRYRAMLLTERIRSLPKPIPAMATSRVWQSLPGSHPKSRLTRLKRMLAGVSLPADRRYARYVRIFDVPLVNELLLDTRHGSDPEPEGLVAMFGAVHSRADVVAAARCVDTLLYLPYDLLTKVDRASMLHNLEVRSPFMDHELVQFAAGLTTDQLLKGGPKRMLREAFAKDLPDFVFKRPKMGFAVPIGEWFRGPLRGMLRDNLFAGDSFGKQHFNVRVVERLVDEHERERVDHSQRLYALLMLELWWRWHRSAG